MVTYTKELTIPRIMPKLMIDIENLIENFGNHINKIELKKIYDIYYEEYEILKHKFIAESN